MQDFLPDFINITFLCKIAVSFCTRDKVIGIQNARKLKMLLVFVLSDTFCIGLTRRSKGRGLRKRRTVAVQTGRQQCRLDLSFCLYFFVFSVFSCIYWHLVGRSNQVVVEGGLRKRRTVAVQTGRQQCRLDLSFCLYFFVFSVFSCIYWHLVGRSNQVVVEGGLRKRRTVAVQTTFLESSDTRSNIETLSPPSLFPISHFDTKKTS